MCRGKESFNRIELSQLVQDLLNFGVLGSLQLSGWGGWVDGGGGCLGGRGWLGGTPTHMHMHVYTCMHMHAHACVVNMIISCKWPAPLDLGKSWGFPMMFEDLKSVETSAPMGGCIISWVGGWVG